MIYYVYDEMMPIYALLVYAKGARSEMTADQKKAVAALAAALKVAMKGER